jgi:hypothetical protein
MIIGFSGLIGTGKDTAANMAAERLQGLGHSVYRDSFANSLKDAAAVVFGWPRHLLEGNTAESREWREQPDEFWSKAFGHAVTPRWALQYMGTDVMRTHFHENIWVDSLIRRAGDRAGVTIISDVRFPNEVQAVRQNGISCMIQRGHLPEWFGIAAAANAGDAFAQARLSEFGIHPSETSWAGCEFDLVVSNDGSIADLKSAIYHFVDSMVVPNIQ